MSCTCFHCSAVSLPRSASKYRAFAFSSSARACATLSIPARILASFGWSSFISGSSDNSAFSRVPRRSTSVSRCDSRISSIDFRCASVSFNRSTIFGLFHHFPWSPCPPNALSNGGRCSPNPAPGPGPIPRPPPGACAPAAAPANNTPAIANPNRQPIPAFIALSSMPLLNFVFLFLDLDLAPFSYFA